jgi:RNA polymerase sigma factor (sigma-70 family)
MDKPEIVYYKYGKKIFNLAYRMTGNRDDANDITQETFIQAFKSIDQFRGESHIYTWLFKIAKNNCTRFLEKKQKTTFMSLQELVDKASSPVSQELSENEKSLYIAQVKNGCLSGLLRCLSLQQRMVFILNVLLELPVEQVAGVIDKSENAARILVHRAKQNIKEYLCRNCSLYDLKNHCRCENMINFSLKQGWLDAGSEVCCNTLRIENEIGSLKKVVNLYKTLQDEKPSDDLRKQLQLFLTGNEEFLIFSDKKVK